MSYSISYFIKDRSKIKDKSRVEATMSEKLHYGALCPHYKQRYLDYNSEADSYRLKYSDLSYVFRFVRLQGYITLKGWETKGKSYKSIKRLAKCGTNTMADMIQVDYDNI